MNSKTQAPFANPDKSGQAVRSIVTLGIVCLLLFTTISCRNTNEEEKEPGDVPFTELSLSGGESVLSWIFQTQPESSLIIINSDEELRNRINEMRAVPGVDFSQYTVLLAYGIEDSFISIVDKSLQRISHRNYVLNVTLQPYTVSSARSHWHVTIVTDKLDEGSRVALNITRNEKREAIEVPFTELSLSGPWEASCSWNDRWGQGVPDEVVIINNDSELRPHITCRGEYTLPDINFSEHSLLLANGNVNSSPWRVRVVAFQQISTNIYRLDVEVTPGHFMAMRRWSVGLITNKWNADNKIEINRTIVR